MSQFHNIIGAFFVKFPLIQNEQVDVLLLARKLGMFIHIQFRQPRAPQEVSRRYEKSGRRTLESRKLPECSEFRSVR